MKAPVAIWPRTVARTQLSETVTFCAQLLKVQPKAVMPNMILI
jgi:hypothetical protein